MSCPAAFAFSEVHTTTEVPITRRNVVYEVLCNTDMFLQP
jgi:hypothetical protein